MIKRSAVVIGNHTQGLGIVRSAGMEGSPTWVVNDAALCTSRFSKYISGYKQLRRRTLCRLNQKSIAEHLLESLVNLPVGNGALLFPVNEDITRFIFVNAERLRGKYFVPETPLDLIYDKYRFNMALPDSAQLDTRLWSDPGVRDISRRDSFIVKGRMGNPFRDLTGSKAILLKSFVDQEQRRVFESLSPEDVIVQRLIETDRPVLSVCSLSIDGKPIGLFQYEKLRQHPNRFGTGTYLRSVKVDALNPLAEQLLGNLRYTGISEIEFIYDPETQGYKVIEMNPRTWKSIHFSTLCGQNLVAKYLSFSLGQTIATDLDYTVGRYWTDLATDVPQMFRERRLFSYHKGCFECAWDRTDPRPALALWTLWPLIALEKCLAKIGK